MHPIVIVLAFIVIVLGLIGIGQRMGRCLWYIVAPIGFVIACVLLYNWLN